MRPTVYVYALGRVWALLNESSRPDADVKEMLRFVLDATGGLSAKGVVRVLDAGVRSRGHFSGAAGDRRRHSMPKWTGRSRYMMRLTIPLDEMYEDYGKPRICWHSTELRRLAAEPRPGPNGGVLVWDPQAAYDEVARRYAAGETRIGRWPIYVIADWRELFVHLAAHEAAHLIQYDRDRGAGGSEIFCEEFAARVLAAYREEAARVAAA